MEKQVIAAVAGVEVLYSVALEAGSIIPTVAHFRPTCRNNNKRKSRAEVTVIRSIHKYITAAGFFVEVKRSVTCKLRSICTVCTGVAKPPFNTACVSFGVCTYIVIVTIVTRYSDTGTGFRRILRHSITDIDVFASARTGSNILIDKAGTAGIIVIGIAVSGISGMTVMVIDTVFNTVFGCAVRRRIGHCKILYKPCAFGIVILCRISFCVIISSICF